MVATRLDPIDRKILSELQADGRMTNVELARRVGISAPPCLRRVRTLEESGLIGGYHADVNARDFNGYTAMHHAAARGDNEMIEYLVSKGGDVMVVSRRGQTTVDMANGPVQRVSPFPKPVDGAQLVESWPYRYVRHPMYSGIVLFTLGVGLAYANPVVLLTSFTFLVFFMAKTGREEEMLVAGVPGYRAYRSAVHWRLIPFVM